MNKTNNIKKIMDNGLIALKNNKTDVALDCFNEVLELEPENKIAWTNKGIVLRKMGKLGESLECYNKALEIDPDFSNALMNKARTLKLQKKFDLALFTYEEILELYPDHAEALEESESVRSLLAKNVKVISETDKKKQIDNETMLLKQRKKELSDFLEKSKNNIGASIEKIEKIFNSGIKEEAVEHKNRVLKAIVSFNEQLNDRLKHIAEEFVTIDFKEENRDLIEKWNNFKDQKIKRLQELL